MRRWALSRRAAPLARGAGLTGRSLAAQAPPLSRAPDRGRLQAVPAFARCRYRGVMPSPVDSRARGGLSGGDANVSAVPEENRSGRAAGRMIPVPIPIAGAEGLPGPGPTHRVRPTRIPAEGFPGPDWHPLAGVMLHCTLIAPRRKQQSGGSCPLAWRAGIPWPRGIPRSAPVRGRRGCWRGRLGTGRTGKSARVARPPGLRDTLRPFGPGAAVWAPGQGVATRSLGGGAAPACGPGGT
jgi:hypothetical protein